MAKILVIDDEAQIRDLLRRCLERQGHEVHAAADGKRGLTLFHEHPADLVITDLLMPECDGIEVISALRRNGVNAPILALSGTVGLGFLHNALAFGATRGLVKPFTLEELVDAVDDLLEAPA